MSGDLAERARIESSAGVLLVTSRGVLSSSREAAILSQRIERALNRTGLRRVVFDNRDSLPSVESAHDYMWNWIEHCSLIDEAAFVMVSSVRQWRVELNARQRGLRVRGFSRLDDALRSLRSSARSAIRLRVHVPKADNGS